MSYPTRITPQVGAKYANHNGSTYLCIGLLAGVAKMRRTSDGWTLDAHGVGQYPDGTIEWDYSTGGHWEGKQWLKA